MSHKYYIITVLLLFSFIGCQAKKKEQNKGIEKNYIFFIHNKFLEENPDNTYSDTYGVTLNYKGIVESYKNDGFVVFSENRPAETNEQDYARKVVSQIDSLISKGIKPNHITVIGTSKGGYIAQFVSTFAKQPDMNFVFIGSFQDEDIERLPTINFCGNILSIYEKSDVFGVSAIKRKETSKLKVNQFKEIELNTGLKHGFLYIASDLWIKPSKMWAKRNYQLVE